jgi:hypothetical protein
MSANWFSVGFHKITQEVMSDVDVLGLRVLNGILGDVDSTSIIIVDNHGILERIRSCLAVASSTVIGYNSFPQQYIQPQQ